MRRTKIKKEKLVPLPRIIVSKVDTEPVTADQNKRKKEETKGWKVNFFSDHAFIDDPDHKTSETEEKLKKGLKRVIKLDDKSQEKIHANGFKKQPLQCYYNSLLCPMHAV